MKNKSYIPLLAVFGAIMLAVMAAIAPSQSFLGHDSVYAQTIDDATLSGLTVGTLTLSPTFDANVMTYTARAPSGTNKVTVTATAANSQATVSISPSDQDPGTDGDQVLLAGGQNRVIRVTVRSEDRRVTEVYTITVYQIRTTPSDNNNLSSLTLSGVTLSPPFAASKTMYMGRAAYSTEQTTVSYGKDIGATAVIQDSTDTDHTDADTDASGHQVNLASGDVTEINVVVTPEDGSAARTYTVMIYRENLVKSDDATLAASDGLTLSDGATPIVGAAGFTYVATTTSYPNVRVANTVRAVTVATDTAHDGAVAVIRPADQDAETDGHQVLLSAGAKTVITVVVTAENGSTNTYTATVYRARRVASDDADLSVLRLSDLTLSPAFASNKIGYMARAVYGTDKTTVSYTADVGASVVITATPEGGSPVTEDADTDASGHQVDLGAGINTAIAVAVTAEDTSTTKIYTVTVYRESLVRSDNPSLADTDGLTLVASNTATLTGFTYAAGTKSYPDVRVTNAGDAVTVATATADDGAMAVITPADQDALTPGHQVLLPAGAKTNIMIRVTAEDGATTDTYSITVYRARRVASDDADLSALRLSGMALSPAFASNKIGYTARAEYIADKTTVSYTADVGATVAITATPGTGAAVTIDADTTAPGYQVDLVAGVNTVIAVAVTAEDTSTTKTYTVTVYRENLPPSDNASLATSGGLALSDSAGTAIEAAAGFTYAAGTKSYPNVRVANAVRTVTVAAVPAHLGAMAVITPADQDALTPGHQVVLPSAAKTDIMVEVTAEDGTTTETYSVTIYRGRRVAADDADLSALSLSGVTLSPAFASNKTEYTGTANFSTQMTTISYTADIGATSVAISAGPTASPVEADADNTAPGYQVRLLRGQAIEIRVTVTAEDATTANLYTITVYRDNAPSSDATLQTLSLSDLTLMPEFAPTTTEYTAEIDFLETTTVEAMAAHSAATVVGTGEKTLVVGDNAISVMVTAEDGSTETYTVTITVIRGETLLQRYDANRNGRIDLSEARTAVDDYLFNDVLTKEQAQEVVNLYLFG